MRPYHTPTSRPPARGPDPWHDRTETDLAAAEFAAAVYRYQLRTGRRYPAWSEVLDVLLGLGYRRPKDHRPP